MKKKLTLLTLLIFAATLIEAQTLPSKEHVLSHMKRANDYFMAKWPDPGVPIVGDRVRPSNIWTRATYYEGLMALNAIQPEKRYVDYALAWGEAHGWGLAWKNDNRNADDMCCGQTYIDLYRMDPKPEKIKILKEAIDKMVASDKIDDWWWIDALHMAMPLFARLGTLENDTKYWDRLFEMYLHTRNAEGGKGLYNPKDRLWWRDKDFDPPYKEPNGEDCYWSRGNGWVIAAMARVLEENPPSVKHRKEYARMLKKMSAALLKVQREDGFWNVSLHDPGNYGGPESSGTAFFVYGMAWGINHGYLSKTKYLPAVVKAWNGLCKEALHENGFIGYMQGTGKEPASSQPVNYDTIPNFEDYGLGAFLLAGSEVYKLTK
ncbi:MAG TPA: glycoside hydrolase family 88 protein [Prolixibacteraceae bacterium]|jgi:rhamnogalacturonyl hydrolase YesR|nr:glycoside hydrolase family 88 protein [Bacteroidales bacterium]HNZ69023.1 glycoside hydrolase family 88 protein [Prolixibacteraceae bacterium]HOC86681.1 glycoside hydrolase family 88 protein [Prolixibacteraceae bacterium]HOF55003.1 glycoside hydrolase family 88 protein [Prolixibacteraceae bacterium]HOG94600.1 glycoside hydrolase family 88 protein [Prolixibacteraceae bacterium]